jgi:type II secretory pathway pseudopilin PulG
MNNHKGFTVIEMIIGGAILLIITMIALSFFVFQSRHGGQLMKDTAVRENVSSALLMIKRDIMHAGSGLDKHPELSVWVTDLFSGSGSPTCFRKLYVSYGGYLSPMAPPDVPNLGYTDVNNIYSVYGNQSGNNGAIFTGTSSPYTFTIAATPNDIYGVLTSDAAQTDPGRPGPVPSGTQTFQRYSAAAWPSGYAANSYIPKYQFTVNATGLSGTVAYTPVIAYELVTSTSNVGSEKGVADAQFPELRRNGVTILGGGRDKTLKITPPGDSVSPAGGFRIRCQFIDNSTTTPTETWVPITGTTTPFPQGQTFTNLRMVEVQIRYRTLRRNYSESGSGRKEAWTQEMTKTINISPRELVLATYQ